MMVMRTMRLMRVRITYTTFEYSSDMNLCHVVRVDFLLLQLHQSFYVLIIDLEIIAFEFLGLALLAVRARLSLLALTKVFSTMRMASRQTARIRSVCCIRAPFLSRRALGQLSSGAALLSSLLSIVTAPALDFEF